jgi:CRP/FNR family transcriptional regulator, cyclic AMP receptor protein
MRARFEGPRGKELLVEALRRQNLVMDDTGLARSIAALLEVQEIEPGDVVIRQGEADNHVYFILEGELSVRVNDREVAVRRGGEHIGEMAAVDPSERRSASIVALSRATLALVGGDEFAGIANEHPELWRRIALSLAHRLRQRSRMLAAKRIIPGVFVGSSREALPIARTVQSLMSGSGIDVRLWTDGVFLPSRYPMESLAEAIHSQDFALLVATPDDLVDSRGEERSAPRDNVIFELGYGMGSLGRERTFILLPRGVNVRIPTDLLGLTPIEYEEGTSETLEPRLVPAVNDLIAVVGALGPK